MPLPWMVIQIKEDSCKVWHILFYFQTLCKSLWCKKHNFNENHVKMDAIFLHNGLLARTELPIMYDF